MKTAIKTILSLSSIALCATVTGCGIGGVSAPTTLNVAANVVTGKVMGGQQPVYGSAIQMYEVGITGYGSASKPLLAPNSVYTNTTGLFRLPAFTCDTPGSLVYMTATGGQPVLGTSNTNLAMMVGLGACSAVTSQYIQINELTTVASVWSLSPFMTGVTNIGSSATNSIGIANAFTSINEVTNTTNGVLGGPALPSNATLPATEINTLADILQSCINSAGVSGTPSTDGQTNGGSCDKLFYLTNNSTDTITAAMVIAQKPGVNVAKLNLLRATSPTFTPALDVNTPPSDWTIAIAYTGGGLNGPRGIATDQQGNVWVTNQNGNSVSEFAPTGAPLSPATTGYNTGGMSGPQGIAIDQSGNAWVANYRSYNTITEISPGGATATSYSDNGLAYPISVAVDAGGNIFVGNSHPTISAFTNSGTPLAGSPFSGGGLGYGVYVTVSPK